MRRIISISVCAMGLMGLSACDETDSTGVDRAFADVNVVDETNLNEVMLSAADPNEAVAYFQRATKEQPERIDLQRSLAMSLVRAKRNTEAVSAWKNVKKHEEAADTDRVELADALIRNNQWDEADQVLDSVPPTLESFKRYRLEAMVADSNREWKKADSFYETAVGLTTRPAGVMNNWGYSKLTRGDYKGAEKLFGEAIKQDSTLFTAKNNMVLARAAQQNYSIPVVPMDQTERAQPEYTMALAAIKQGDTAKGESLLRDAIDTHPQHFDPAVRALEALRGAG